MDSPLTLKHAIILAVLVLVVSSVPVGWLFSTLDADVQSIQYRLDTTNSRLDAMNICRVTQTEAEANKDRIAELEGMVDAWSDLTAACESAIRKTSLEKPVIVQ